MGIRLPDPGQAHIHGTIVAEEEAMEQAAREFLSAKVPTIFPGPLVLWAWNDKAAKKAKAVRYLYETIKECVDSKTQQAMLIPMPDYRPKYPKINPEIEINPNHPNLTIWHNRIDAC
ncbi:MAG: carbon monoxide dehydrogenase, partial [Nitrospirota bacterium]